jgi:hypothetical protein
MKKQVKEKKIVGDVKEFVVKRKTWYRGKGSEHSCLLNEHNQRCCLGFYAGACGLSNKIIRGIAEPNSVIELLQEGQVEDKDGNTVHSNLDIVWKTKLVRGLCGISNTPTCNKLMAVNDSVGITDEERETKLTALFKRLGIKVKFQ